MTYQEVHTVEAAQLMTLLFSVLLFSFDAMNTATEQNSMLCWQCTVLFSVRGG